MYLLAVCTYLLTSMLLWLVDANLYPHLLARSTCIGSCETR